MNICLRFVMVLGYNYGSLKVIKSRIRCSKKYSKFLLIFKDWDIVFNLLVLGMIMGGRLFILGFFKGRCC